MAITLNGLAFDEAHTTVREEYAEVGGRDARIIRISGVIAGESSVVAIESALDAILDAASAEDYSADLSLREGRVLHVRRAKFQREIAASSLLGSFILELEAKSPFEEAATQSEEPWTIAASGATIALETDGNVFSLPRIELVASGALVNPAMSDGIRTLTYMGTVGDGETLVVDAASGTVTLEGVDVTPYTMGEFPRIASEGTTLTYTDDASSAHTASATVFYRARWW